MLWTLITAGYTLPVLWLRLVCLCLDRRLSPPCEIRHPTPEASSPSNHHSHHLGWLQYTVVARCLCSTRRRQSQAGNRPHRHRPHLWRGDRGI